MAVDTEKDQVQPSAGSVSEPSSPSNAANGTEPPVVTLKTWIVSCVCSFK